MKHKWIVQETAKRQRLDVFIADKLTSITRSRIAKLLKNGAGLVNKKKAAVHEFLKTDDVIEFDDDFNPINSLIDKTKNNVARSSPALSELKIIKQTSDWIVLDKPIGLLVHPAPRTKELTLVDQILELDPKIAKIGEDPERPGIIHRLDREVSGLMVIARTQSAFDDLKRQFAEHKVEKKYLALVYGEIKEDEGDIKFRIARSKSKARMAARPVNEEEGQAAWTHYKTIKRFKHASLVELEILSGRTHQIRTHLLALNHPIIGDPLYKRKKEDRNIIAPRLMLQSISLRFTDPKTKEVVLFNIPPVQAFDDLIKKLS